MGAVLHTYSGRVAHKRIPLWVVRDTHIDIFIFFFCSKAPTVPYPMSLLALPADVQRLIINEYLWNVDAVVARCACRALRALVSRRRIDACRNWLYEHFCMNGYVALLAWLHAQVPLRETYVGALCETAAKHGHITTLQWLRAHGAPWDGWTCARAAEAGHVSVLEWLRENGAPWDHWTYLWAAQAGRLEVLQWLHTRRAPWDECVCASAALKGHLAALQWLRAHDAPWNELTCLHAVIGGHLAVLQWARANGAPWDTRVCEYASRNKQDEILAWARANGAP